MRLPGIPSTFHRACERCWAVTVRPSVVDMTIAVAEPAYPTRLPPIRLLAAKYSPLFWFSDHCVALHHEMTIIPTTAAPAVATSSDHSHWRAW